MKSLLTVTVNIHEATKLVESVLGERAGADSCHVTIELPQPPPAPVAPSNCDFSLDAPVPQGLLRTMLLQPEQKINQIKDCRAITGWNLKDAKDYVEHIHCRFFHGPTPIR